MKHTSKPTLVPLPEELATQFLDEVVNVIAPFEIYGSAHDALWDGYFADLREYAAWGDFNGEEQLPRPKPLPLLVDAHVLFGFFRAWVRKRGIDPNSMDPLKKQEAAPDRKLFARTKYHPSMSRLQT